MKLLAALVLLFSSQFAAAAESGSCGDGWSFAIIEINKCGFWIQMPQFFVEASLKVQCNWEFLFDLCRNTINQNDHGIRSLIFLCDASRSFPARACHYFQGKHLHEDEALLHFCIGPLRKEDDYSHYCRAFAHKTLNENTPYMSRTIIQPCYEAVDGPKCDMGMGKLCSEDSYICKLLRDRLKDANEKAIETNTTSLSTNLATQSEMCAEKLNKSSNISMWCEIIQEDVKNASTWLEDRCFPIRTNYELCQAKWPPACQVRATVCSENDTLEGCKRYFEEVELCESLKPVQGVLDGHIKYCQTKKTTPQIKRNCQGVLDDVIKNLTKFTQVCPVACDQKHKLCEYCNEMIEVEYMQIWPLCQEKSLLDSTYCRRIHSFCMRYNTNPGCPQVLREDILWHWQFTGDLDVSEFVTKLAKLCEKEPSKECREAMTAILNGPLAFHSAYIVSELCGKYQTACHNLIEASKDVLDDVTRACDVSTWADVKGRKRENKEDKNSTETTNTPVKKSYTACMIVLDDCLQKNYSCPLLIEKQKAVSDYRSFPTLSLTDKKKVIDKWCGGNGSTTMICQSFLQLVTEMKKDEKEQLVPLACADADLCDAMINVFIFKNDSGIEELAKKSCEPWKVDDAVCQSLFTTCHENKDPKCDFAQALMCSGETPEAQSLCLNETGVFCGERRVSKTDAKCTNILDAFFENKKVGELSAALCEFKDLTEPEDIESQERTCLLHTDVAEEVGKMHKIFSQACATKEQQEGRPCPVIRKKCRYPISKDCSQVMDVLNGISFDKDACKDAKSKSCEELLPWYCMSRDQFAEGSKIKNLMQNSTTEAATNETGRDMTFVKDREKCEQLVNGMEKDSAIKNAEFCNQMVNDEELCAIFAQKLDTDKSLKTTYDTYCVGEQLANRICKHIYEKCEEKHTDGSENCTEIVKQYKLGMALLHVQAGDVNQTAEDMANMCSKQNKIEDCEEFIYNNNLTSSDAVMAKVIHTMCAQKPYSSQCERVIEILLKNGSTILDPLSVYCLGVESETHMCQTLFKGCRTKKEINACKALSDYESFLEELKSIDAEPSKLPDLIEKYCMHAPEPKKCKIIKGKIMNTPALIASQLSEVCKRSADLCHEIAEDAFVRNSTIIPLLHSKYCAGGEEDELCKMIQHYCESSKSSECKETKARYCLRIETIAKCITEIKSHCAFDLVSRPGEQVLECNDLVKDATDSKEKIKMLRQLCDNDTASCDGFVDGSITVKTAFTVFEVWCPPQDQDMHKCKTFRQQCRTRAGTVSCQRINALYGEFDDQVCNGKEADLCLDSITRNCDVKKATSVQKKHCDELFDNMGKDDVINLGSKCEDDSVASTCDRVIQKLRELDQLAGAFKVWCQHDKKELKSAKCQQIRTACDRYHDSGCQFVRSVYERPKTIGAIIGMIVGLVIMVLGLVFWIILILGRKKKEEEQKQKREEQKASGQSTTSTETTGMSTTNTFVI